MSVLNCSISLKRLMFFNWLKLRLVMMISVFMMVVVMWLVRMSLWLEVCLCSIG